MAEGALRPCNTRLKTRAALLRELLPSSGLGSGFYSAYGTDAEAELEKLTVSVVRALSNSVCLANKSSSTARELVHLLAATIARPSPASAGCTCGRSR